jgi:hypothetical protein
MIEQLVVNGCSYAEGYAAGAGHVDLARRLNIMGPHGPRASTLAIGGSANSRILRTTLKHSYQTNRPTLYVLGMTFISRSEIPICEPINNFEGRWTNPQNQNFAHLWQVGWSKRDTEQFVKLKLKTEVMSIIDRTEDLMYSMLATISDLKSRGHRVLMFQQADDLYHEYLGDPRLQLFKRPEIIHGFAWRAIEYQYRQGVKQMSDDMTENYVPPEMKHAQIGEHAVLNEYLTSYINEHKLLS